MEKKADKKEDKKEDKKKLGKLALCSFGFFADALCVAEKKNSLSQLWEQAVGLIIRPQRAVYS